MTEFHAMQLNQFHSEIFTKPRMFSHAINRAQPEEDRSTGQSKNAFVTLRFFTCVIEGIRARFIGAVVFRTGVVFFYRFLCSFLFLCALSCSSLSDFFDNEQDQLLFVLKFFLLRQKRIENHH